MSISKTINYYGRKHSPYMGRFVNHLPMAQLALYKMTEDMEKVKAYSEYYTSNFNIDPVKKDFPKVNTIEECLGKRNLYEPCLELIKEEIDYKGMDEVIRKVLNTYSYGMSSGLFHTIIRVSYAIEGARIDNRLVEEVSRALAYYITGYRRGKKLKGKVSKINFVYELEKLFKDPHIVDLISNKSTTGQKIKALYEDEGFLKKGFTIEGSEEEKVLGLLELLLPLFNKTNNILILHCITGLQAVFSLKEYFNDFNEVLDIMTSFIITHLFTLDSLPFDNGKEKVVERSWEDIEKKGSESLDVHTIKYTYSTRKLYDIYKLPELKQSAILRIKK